MIGQEKILEILKELKEKNRFPKFMIIQGGKGWGKKLLCKEISKLLNFIYNNTKERKLCHEYEKKATNGG